MELSLRLHFLFYWLCICIPGSPTLHAQVPLQWEYSTIGTEDGLSDINVLHVIKDQRGFLWIATQNGVNRWDGYQCKNYYYNASDSNSLGGNIIQHILEDREGYLWFCTLGAGWCRYDPRKDSFLRMHKSGNPNGLNSSMVTCAIQDTNGDIWVGTGDGGLLRFNTSTFEFTPYPANTPQTPSPKGYATCSPHITCLLDEGKYLWVGTALGLCLLDKQSGTFNHFPTQSEDPKSALVHPFIMQLHRSEDGFVWVQMPEGKWARYLPDRHSFQTAERLPGMPESVFKGRFQKLNDGSVWQATSHGLQYWFQAPKRFQIDRGTKYPESIFQLANLRGMVEYAGYLWLATGDGLFRTQFGKNNLEQLSALPFFALLAHEDKLYASSRSQGLFCIDSTGKILNFPAPLEIQKASGQQWGSMTNDSWGNILIATRSGAILFNPSNQTFQPLIKSSHLNILSMAWDVVHHRLWAGTLGDGLWAFEFDEHGLPGSCTQFKYIREDHTSLSNDLVFAVWVDQNAAVWAGTDGGLNRLAPNWQTGQKASFQRILRTDGLPDDKVLSLHEDGKSRIWAGHQSKGISVLTSEGQLIQSYGKMDGLPDERMHWGSLWKRSDGTMFMGTDNGLVVFHPDSLNTHLAKAPPLYFTEVLLNNQPLNIGEEITSAPEYSPHIRLKYFQNSLSFRFAALDFRHTSRTQYTYRLEPSNNAWQTIGSRNEVYFDRLPPGDYTLYISQKGFENEYNTHIEFSILPPWWATWWAKTFWIGCLLMASFYLLQLQTALAKRKLWKQFGTTLAAINFDSVGDRSNLNTAFIRDLYQILEARYQDETFSVEELARLMRMSRSQLHRKVGEMTGFSPGQLLQQLRLDQACQLLTETPLTVAEVAFRCGFSDPNYFSRLFSKVLHMTPTEFALKNKPE